MMLVPQYTLLLTILHGNICGVFFAYISGFSLHFGVLFQPDASIENIDCPKEEDNSLVKLPNIVSLMRRLEDSLCFEFQLDFSVFGGFNAPPPPTHYSVRASSLYMELLFSISSFPSKNKIHRLHR